MKGRKNALYFAQVESKGGCSDGESNALMVKVPSKITIGDYDSNRQVLHGRVAPKNPGFLARLERRTSSGWKIVATDDLNGRSRFAFHEPLSKGRYRVHLVANTINARTVQRFRFTD